MNKHNPVLIRNEEEETRQVRHDLRLVVGLNIVFLVILVGLFFFERATGKVDAFFFNLLKF